MESRGKPGVHPEQGVWCPLGTGGDLVRFREASGAASVESVWEGV